MPKRTGDFDSWHLASLADPRSASEYLTAVVNESPELILDAVQDVIQARTATEVSKQAGVTRESLYRSFSSSVGNPRLRTLRDVLRAIGVRISEFSPLTEQATTRKISSADVPTGIGIRKPRKRHVSHVRDDRQLTLFPATPTVVNCSTRIVGVRSRVDAGSRGYSKVDQQIYARHVSTEPGVAQPLIAHYQSQATSTYAH